MKDDPIALLSKPSYRTVVMKMKAPYLNNIFKLCCYTSENVYKIYKWEPNDHHFEITEGRSGKRIMKLKEKSSLPMRCFVPSSCRGYDGEYEAENNRAVAFEMSRPVKCTLLCFSRPEISVYYVNQVKLRE